MKDDYACFSCFNCIVACPGGAISIVEGYHADGGFFDIGYPSLEVPIQPKNAEGLPDEWNAVERIILERRSVRNFKEKPVPEPLLERILEAGRFAPSSGNQQPWKFTVITNRALIDQLEEACLVVWQQLYPMFTDDEAVMNLVETVPDVGAFDPRVQGGIRCVAKKELPIFLNAPAVIFLGCSNKMAFPEQHAGICGQNMTIAAKSLGIGSCWSNFAATVDMIPELKAKLGYDDTWKIYSALCLGYPKFNQEGMVPRQRRPVTWFKPGIETPEIR
jgi:nitroreductase